MWGICIDVNVLNGALSQSVVEYIVTKLIQILLMGLISIISFVTLLVVVTTYSDVISNQAKGILAFIACAVFSVGLIALLEGGRTFGYYKCLHCEETFVPGFVTYTLAVNIIALRMMRCPHCGK